MTSPPPPPHYRPVEFRPNSGTSDKGNGHPLPVTLQCHPKSLSCDNLMSIEKEE